MMLTNYPINRELVAERMRRNRLKGNPEPFRPSATLWTLASWLLRRPTLKRRTRKPTTGAPNGVAPATTP